MTMSLENRRYPRVGLPQGMLVAWQASGARMISRVGTLGLGGLFIRTVNPPGVGDIVKLFFEVPGGEVRARAVVRDSQPGRGMGVEFTAMGHEDRARLDRLVRRLL
jgi:PilZ domain